MFGQLLPAKAEQVVDCAEVGVLVCLGGMCMPGQPSFVANGMIGMTPQMMPQMQVSMCILQTETFKIHWSAIALIQR